MALAAVFFVYVLSIRTYDVASTFLMLGEQTRDWTIALGSLTELPLAGAPSTAGGRGFGPAYYWLLWLGRVTLGPFMDNLPHAGGVFVALLQSIADTWLLVALSRRVHWGLALAMCLLIASAPFDIAISSVIWNPPVSAALIKMATASGVDAVRLHSRLWRQAQRLAVAALPLSPGWRCRRISPRFSSRHRCSRRSRFSPSSTDRANGRGEHSSNGRAAADRRGDPRAPGSVSDLDRSTSRTHPWDRRRRSPASPIRRRSGRGRLRQRDRHHRQSVCGPGRTCRWCLRSRR